MKKIGFVFLSVILTLSFVACEPDDLDAFADGYRDGYEAASGSYYYDDYSIAPTDNGDSLSMGLSEENQIDK
ncbi:MAG: hypothetical protein IJT61_01395 [Bacteroidales bacterium]|nr:hypothetical protein [Bacteroidales bacterium]